MHTVVKGKKSKILEIHIFEFTFEISFKEETFPPQTRPCVEKVWKNQPICSIWIFNFRIENASSPSYLPKIGKKISIFTSCTHMGCKEIEIVMESEINNCQIYVHVFYLLRNLYFNSILRPKMLKFHDPSASHSLSTAF